MEAPLGDFNAMASSNGSIVNGFMMQPPIPLEAQNMTPGMTFRLLLISLS
jgi:hypothetical protein